MEARIRRIPYEEEYFDPAWHIVVDQEFPDGEEEPHQFATMVEALIFFLTCDHARLHMEQQMHVAVVGPEDECLFWSGLQIHKQGPIFKFVNIFHSNTLDDFDDTPVVDFTQ